MKGWVLGSHLKVEGRSNCPWTELYKEQGKSLTEIHSDTWREAVLFVLFPLQCQLQCQPQNPPSASAMSSVMFLRPTPVTGTSAGPLHRTKQMMEISHSGTKDLKETCPLAFSIPMTNEHRHLGISIGNATLSFLQPWANVQEFVAKTLYLQFMSQMEASATSTHQIGPYIYFADFFSK